MRRAFVIVGPTATGKSELAADVAGEIGAEIVSADAFQIYRGLDLLTAKPDASTLAKAPHHLIGTAPLNEEMNAEKYRCAATRAIDEINSRGKLAMVVGGSGLYIRALTDGLAPLPEADPKLREELNAMSLDELRSRLAQLDPEAGRTIDTKNRRRLVRAAESMDCSRLAARGEGDCGDEGSNKRFAQRSGYSASINDPGYRCLCFSRPGGTLSTNQSAGGSNVRTWCNRGSAHRRCDGGDRFTDDRFARDSRTARWKDITLAMYRGDPASHSPLRQKTVDLVSAAN